MPQNPFTGVSELLSVLLNWLLGLVPLVAALLVAYHQIAKTASGDEMTVAQHNRATRNVIVSAVIAVSAMGLARFVLYFF